MSDAQTISSWSLSAAKEAHLASCAALPCRFSVLSLAKMSKVVFAQLAMACCETLLYVWMLWLQMSEVRALEMQRILATALRRDANASISPRSNLGTVEIQVSTRPTQRASPAAYLSVSRDVISFTIFKPSRCTPPQLWHLLSASHRCCYRWDGSPLELQLSAWRQLLTKPSPVPEVEVLLPCRSSCCSLCAPATLTISGTSQGGGIQPPLWCFRF